MGITPEDRARANRASGTVVLVLVGAVATVMIAAYSCGDDDPQHRYGGSGTHFYSGHSFLGRGSSGGSSFGSGTVRGGFGSTGHSVGT